MRRFIRFSFKRFVLLSGKLARSLAGAVELTPARVDLLLHLREGRILQRDLALDLCVSPSTLSKLLKALEKLGLVARVVDENDRRMRIVSLTEAAQRVVKELADSYFAVDAGASTQFSAEATLLLDWTRILREGGVRDEPLAPRHHDCSGLVRHMAFWVRRTDYDHGDWRPGDPESGPGVRRRQRPTTSTGVAE